MFPPSSGQKKKEREGRTEDWAVLFFHFYIHISGVKRRLFSPCDLCQQKMQSQRRSDSGTHLGIHMVEERFLL